MFDFVEFEVCVQDLELKIILMCNLVSSMNVTLIIEAFGAYLCWLRLFEGLNKLLWLFYCEGFASPVHFPNIGS